MTFGENLKRLRKKKRLTLGALADAAGISDPYLNQLETGQRNNPSIVVINKLAEALGVTSAALMK